MFSCHHLEAASCMETPLTLNVFHDGDWAYERKEYHVNHPRCSHLVGQHGDGVSGDEIVGLELPRLEEGLGQD